MNTNKLVNQLLELQQLVVDFSDIERMIYWPSREHQRENDVEHSYGLALLAWYVAEKLQLKLDHEKLLKYALVHDLVEVHAGDVPVWGAKEALAQKHANEAKAARKLANDLDYFPSMHEYIRQYENKIDNEAQFVYALDKILPGLVHLLDERQFFLEHRITRTQHQQKVQEHIKKISTYPELLPLYKKLMEIYEEKFEFYNDAAQTSSS